MSSSKHYLLSFTTLFYNKKGYVLMFNRHQNVQNEDDFPLSFEPWNRYSALIMRDMKMGTKVKHATSIVYPVESDFSTIFEGSIPSAIQKGSLYYLSSLNEKLNKAKANPDYGVITGGYEKVNDFYGKLAEIIEKLNGQLVKSVSLPKGIERTKVIENGREILSFYGANKIGVGETSKYDLLQLLDLGQEGNSPYTLELLSLLPQEGYNQATELADLFLNKAEMSSYDRLMTIQYGEKALDIAKANFVKSVIDSLTDLYIDGQNVKSIYEGDGSKFENSISIQHIEIVNLNDAENTVKTFLSFEDRYTESTNVKKDVRLIVPDRPERTVSYGGGVSELGDSQKVFIEGESKDLLLSPVNNYQIFKIADEQHIVGATGSNNFNYGDIDIPVKVLGSTVADMQEYETSEGSKMEGHVLIDDVSDKSFFYASVSEFTPTSSVVTFNYGEMPNITSTDKSVAIYFGKLSSINHFSGIRKHASIDLSEGAEYRKFFYSYALGSVISKAISLGEVDESIVNHSNVYFIGVDDSGAATFIEKNEGSFLDGVDIGESEEPFADVEVHWGDSGSKDKDYEVHIEEVLNSTPLSIDQDTIVSADFDGGLRRKVDTDIDMTGTSMGDKVIDSLDVNVESHSSVNRRNVDHDVELLLESFVDYVELDKAALMDGFDVSDILDITYDLIDDAGELSIPVDALLEVRMENVDTMSAYKHDAMVEIVQVLNGDYGEHIDELDIDFYESSSLSESFLPVMVDTVVDGAKDDLSLDTDVEFSSNAETYSIDDEVELESVGLANYSESTANVGLLSIENALIENDNSVEITGTDEAVVNNASLVDIEIPDIAEVEGLSDVSLEVVDNAVSDGRKDAAIEFISMGSGEGIYDTHLENPEQGEINSVSDAVFVGGDIANFEFDTYVSLEENDFAEMFYGTFDVEIESDELSEKGSTQDVILNFIEIFDLNDQGAKDVSVEFVDYGVFENTSDGLIELANEGGNISKDELVTIDNNLGVGFTTPSFELSLENVEQANTEETFDTSIDGVEKAKESDAAVELTVEFNEFGDIDKTDDVYIESQDQASVSSIAYDVSVNSWELGSFGNSLDVSVENNEKVITDKDIEAVLDYTDTADSEQDVYVLIETQDLADSDSTSDVEISAVDMAEFSGENNVSIESPVLADSAGWVNTVIEKDDTANLEKTAEVLIEGTELSEPSDTFSDVVFDDFDLASRGRGRKLTLMDGEAFTRSSENFITIDEEEKSDSNSSQLLHIYENDEVTTGGSTIMILEEDNLGDSKTTSYLDIEDDEIVDSKMTSYLDIKDEDLGDSKKSSYLEIDDDDLTEKFSSSQLAISDKASAEKHSENTLSIDEYGSTSDTVVTKQLSINVDDQAIKDRLLRLNIEEDGTGSIEREHRITIEEREEIIRDSREFPIEIEGDDQGVGLLPPEPPWGPEHEKKGKVWLMMGKNYPAWNGWNNKKTR